MDLIISISSFKQTGINELCSSRFKSVCIKLKITFEIAIIRMHTVNDNNLKNKQYKMLITHERLLEQGFSIKL